MGGGASTAAAGVMRRERRRSSSSSNYQGRRKRGRASSLPDIESRTTSPASAALVQALVGGPGRNSRRVSDLGPGSDAASERLLTKLGFKFSSGALDSLELARSDSGELSSLSASFESLSTKAEEWG